MFGRNQTQDPTQGRPQRSTAELAERLRNNSSADAAMTALLDMTPDERRRGVAGLQAIGEAERTLRGLRID